MEFIIQQIKQETPDAVSLVLHTERGTELSYHPGQFLTLVFATPFGEKRRSYSFSSAPGLNEPPTITVKKVANGEFSRKLVDHAKPGDLLVASSVNGLFRLPAVPDQVQQYFFFAAGSGITPCFSMIKTILFLYTQQVVLIYSNRSQSDTIFLNELIHLQQQFPERFQVRFLISHLFDVFNSRLSKWLLPQLLDQYLKVDKQKALFYVCGPFDYMQMVQLTLLSEDVQLQSIHKENFSTVPRITRPTPPDRSSHEVVLEMNDRRYLFSVQYPQTILAAAKANGISIPYSCEAGRCGSCVATCTRGTVWMAYNEVLLDEEVAAGRFLCCQAYPIGGDVEVKVAQ